MNKRLAWGVGLVGAIAVLVAAGLLAHALAPRAGGPQLPPPQDGIVLSTRTATRSAFFGDRVEASALVLVDTRTIDADSLTLRPDFVPFRIEATHTQERRTGPILVLSARWTLTCLDPGCLPGKTSHTFAWAPVELGYRLRGTSLRRALTQPFEPVTILTRVAPGATAHPRFRVAPPVVAATHYRIRPRVLALLLVLGGLALCAVALALVLAATRGLRRRAPAPADPLVLVLEELHRAAHGNGDSGRRRRALERLAELVEPHDEELGGETRTLAWAPDDPPRDAIEELARRAREAHR